jgi:hypothetical protein
LLALEPKLSPGTAPVVHHTGCEGFYQSSFIHVGDHQHFPSLKVPNHSRQQTFFELQLLSDYLRLFRG